MKSRIANPIPHLFEHLRIIDRRTKLSSLLKYAGISSNLALFSNVLHRRTSLQHQHWFFDRKFPARVQTPSSDCSNFSVKNESSEGFGGYIERDIHSLWGIKRKIAQVQRNSVPNWLPSLTKDLNITSKRTPDTVREYLTPWL